MFINDDDFFPNVQLSLVVKCFVSKFWLYKVALGETSSWFVDLFLLFLWKFRQWTMLWQCWPFTLWSCNYLARFAMFSCYFLPIIRHSIQLLCPVFSRKVFFRCSEGRNKVWTTKTSPSSRQAWPPSDSCSSIATNTTCTARGKQSPVLRIAPFHPCN